MLAAQSDLLELTFHRTSRDDVPDLRSEVLRRLRPVLGAEADAIVARIAAKPTFLRHGFAFEPPPPGKGDVPGAQTYTAYEAWELPLAALTAGVPAERRDAAVRALSRLEPEGGPAWETPETAPAWTKSPPAREGFATVLARERADRADLVRANATLLGPERAEWSLGHALDPVLGRDPAFALARPAFSWATPRARATGPGGRDGREWTAWSLWDVPLERILERAPADRRDAVRRALASPLLGD